MARPADFDLARELARPNFTPGQRDVPALVALIATDEAAAIRAAPALAALGAAARTRDEVRAAIEARLASADDAGAARLVAALGLVARTGDAAARAAVLARLGDARVRVRRAAIVALGKLGATREREAGQRAGVELREAARRAGERRSATQPPLVELRDGDRRGEDRREAPLADDDLHAVRTALLARWDAADVPGDERRALAEALGKIGGPGVRERLAALAADGDKELARRRDRALLVTDREARRGEDSEVRGDRAPTEPLVVRLGCRPALAELLVTELRGVGLPGAAVRDDAVDVTLAAPWHTLFASRLWATAAIRFDEPALRAAHGDRARVTEAIVRAIVGPRVRGVLEAWTRGPIRWRLALARGHQRAVVWTVAKEVTRRAPHLVNDPTRTTWDIRVDDDEGVLELVPRRAPDPRFAYRVAEVPAASHPSVAAAVVWLAGVQPGERVWDPFCGSGVELVEAALRGAGRVIGGDVEEAALAAARANLDAARADRDAARADRDAARADRDAPAALAWPTVELVRGDARRDGPERVDAIVTNPPLGSRVHVDAGALLADALPNLTRRLAPGGRLVWITPQWRRTGPVAEAQGLVLVRSLFVDLGGVRGRLERWDRRR